MVIITPIDPAYFSNKSITKASLSFADNIDNKIYVSSILPLMKPLVANKRLLIKVCSE